MTEVDFGLAAEDYVRYRAGFPAELFDRLATFRIGERGQRVLDLGTGTGSLARGFARRGCEVVGVDPSEELLAAARRVAAEQGLGIDFVLATAERTSLGAKSFDVVAAGQSWHWFDRPMAMRELKRVLRPQGALVIVHFDWIPLPGSAIEMTEELIDQYNPDWGLGGGTGLHAEWLGDVRSNGFVQVETFSFDVAVRYSHEAWCGRVRASAGVRASLSAGMVERFDESLRRTLAERFPDEPLEMAHCCWAVVCRAPG